MKKLEFKSGQYILKQETKAKRFFANVMTLVYFAN